VSSRPHDDLRSDRDLQTPADVFISVSIGSRATRGSLVQCDQRQSLLLHDLYMRRRGEVHSRRSDDRTLNSTLTAPAAPAIAKHGDGLSLISSEGICEPTDEGQAAQRQIRPRDPSNGPFHSRPSTNRNAVTPLQEPSRRLARKGCARPAESTPSTPNASVRFAHAEARNTSARS